MSAERVESYSGLKLAALFLKFIWNIESMSVFLKYRMDHLQPGVMEIQIYKHKV